MQISIVVANYLTAEFIGGASWFVSAVFYFHIDIEETGEETEDRQQILAVN